MEYSVLMSVYKKETAEYLRQSMESILKQTIPTDDYILVCDGLLNEELDAVIEEEKAKFGAVLKVIRLKENVGLGKALNIGIQHCKNDLVARMDSDDIAYFDRCEKQLRVFDTMDNISICSGIVEEFSDTINNVEARRVPPETHSEIVEYAKKRNPFNHPCVMYKKSAVESVGSYQDFYLLEDYYLWLRMILKGYQGYNIQEPLLHMRAGNGMYKRRSGWKYAVAQRNLFKYMKDHRFINNSQYLKSVILRGGSSMAPNWLRKRMFKLALRE